MFQITTNALRNAIAVPEGLHRQVRGSGPAFPTRSMLDASRHKVEIKCCLEDGTRGTLYRPVRYGGAASQRCVPTSQLAAPVPRNSARYLITHNTVSGD